MLQQRMLLLTLALLSAGAAGAAVRKCCGPQQNFNGNFDCVNSTVDRRNDTVWWFPPPEQIEDANVSRMFLEEDHTKLMTASPSCSPDEQMRLMKLDDPEIVQFSFVASGSDIMLRVTEEYAPENHLRPPADYCVDAIVHPGYGNNFFGAKVCPCTAAPCVRKCCPPWNAFNASLHCVAHNLADWEPLREKAVTKQKHVLLTGKIPKCDVQHIILFGNSSMFQLNEDSHMVQRTMDRKLVRQGLKPHEYCGERVVAGNDSQEVLLVCLRPEMSTMERVSGALLLLGGTLLASAAAVQTLCVLPARVRRRVHARLALCHNASLAVGFLTLGGHKLRPEKESLVVCRVLAYIIQMSFLAAFFWLNVMCIDISWAFSGLRPPQGSAAERDRKKFFMYSAYAWGGTAAIAAVTLIVEYSPAVSVTSRLKPNIGETRCWFKDNMSVLLYFYGPMAVLLLGNLVLFSYTACRIVTVRRETVILDMNDSRRHEGNTATTYKRDRQRLALYGKLFTLMGLTWVTEILSFAVGGPMYYWYLTDCVNILRAVYIFYIFCCKRSVLKLIRMRLPSFCPCAMKPASNRPLGGSSGQQTASIRLSDKRKQSTKSEEGEQETRA